MARVRWFLFAVAICACMTGCSMMLKSADKLDERARDYLRMVRWQEVERANLTYVDNKERDTYVKSMAAAKGVKIIDYRIITQECDTDKGTGELRVTYDYLREPSFTVRSVEELQKWRYVEDGTKSGWRLTTPLPNFP
jgi:hypothetical protein